MERKGENGSKKRVLVVDHHPVVRERLVELLGGEPDLACCGEADNGHHAMALIDGVRPNAVILEITLKDTYGIDLIRQIHDRWRDLPVLVLSAHDESLYAERSLRAGARGYISKQEPTRSIIIALRVVLGGEIYLSPRVAGAILNRIARRPGASGSSPADLLSDRELEVFNLLGQGVGVRQIGDRLHVSVKTVEAHRANIKQKLKIRTSAQLLRFAIQHSLEEAK